MQVALTKVSLDTARQKLGKVAWAAWGSLLLDAGPDNMVRTTREDLAADLGVSPQAALRALTRLNRAGLVASCGRARVEVRGRVVGDSAYVPVEVIGLNTHGGARFKPDHAERQREVIGLKTAVKPITSQGPKTKLDVDTNLQTDHFHKHPTVQVVPNTRQVTENVGDDFEDVELQSVPCPPDPKPQVEHVDHKPPSDSPSGSSDPDLIRIRSPIPSGARRAGCVSSGPETLKGFFSANGTYLGLVIGGKNTTTTPPRPGRFGTPLDLRDAGLLPSYPGAVVENNFIPKASLLRGEEDPAVDAERLWRAFQSVARFRGAKNAGGAGWARKRSASPAVEEKGRAVETLLRNCARAMRDHDVEPVAWVAWSWDVWNHAAAQRGRASQPPPLRWVFSDRRVVDRHGWFRSETGHFRTRRMARWAPAVRDLWARWNSLLSRVRGLHPVDHADRVRGEVAVAFPDGYEAHSARAVAASAAQRAEIADAFERGVYLWTR